MVVFMMIYFSFLLPAAALLHIGQWAISRSLDLAHCPICCVPTHPPFKKMRSNIQIYRFRITTYPFIS